MRAYGQLLRLPHVAALLTATTLGRLPIAIDGLAVILFVREITGSFASAGLVAGALALGIAIGAPLAARLVDRRGTATLLSLALAHAAALLALWALGSAGAAVGVLAAIALCAGTAFPPSGAVLRSRWPKLVSDPDLQRTAFAFDSVTIEISFVSGPLITAVLVALIGPQAALALSALLIVAGTAVFLAVLPAHTEPVASEAARPLGLLGPLAKPSIRLLALSTFPVGFCIGAIEVALPAFSESEGSGALAGVLLALWSGASGIGGLYFGARRQRRGLVDTYLAIALVFPLACLPMVGAFSPLAMAGLVMLAGLPIAPLIASRNQLVGRLAPSGAAAESFTWLLTALVGGSAAGAALAGVLVQAESWRLAVIAGVGVAALGAALALGRRGVLRPGIPQAEPTLAG